MISLNKRFAVILSTAVLILFIPFIAMQFSKDVDWSLFDFVVAGILLLGTGLLLELILKNVKKKKYRILMLIGLFASLFLIWAELAVGIFGTPFAGN